MVETKILMRMMMMDDLILEIGQDCFKRVDAEHPIDWRYNDCDPPTMLVLKTKKKPPKYTETDGVQVRTIQQRDGQYATVFVLKDPLCGETFRVFCEDAIESSRNIDSDEVADFAFERYVKWMYLFKPHSNDKLSETEIRGLIGELYVLKSKFIPSFGALSSLRSWMNRLRGKQDFIEHDKWYEVKTLLEGNDTIHISSLEQLSRTDAGELVVVNLKRSSPESDKRVTLNSLYNDVIDSLPTFSLKRQFAEIILASGFVADDPSYDGYCYEIIDVVGYGVMGGFPRLTPENLPFGGIPRVEYEILIDAIKEFEAERWN